MRLWINLRGPSRFADRWAGKLGYIAKLVTARDLGNERQTAQRWSRRPAAERTKGESLLRTPDCSDATDEEALERRARLPVYRIEEARRRVLGETEMSIQLTVPLVLQQASNECWYASACMVAYFRRPGPRLGLPGKWTANRGITVPDFVQLAQAEGLKPILAPAAQLTAQQLEVLLRNDGPLWCAGLWDGVGHVVVLTGVDGQTTYINDPNPAKGKRVETVAWFNAKLARVPNSLMYMPP